jgi:hypothetical protein
MGSKLRLLMKFGRAVTTSFTSPAAQISSGRLIASSK